MASHIALRAGLAFRAASVDGADATTRTESASLGIAWTSAGLQRPGAFGVGARLDLMGLHEEVRRETAAPSAPAVQDYWSVGGDLVGQIGYGLSRTTGVLAGGGLEEILTAADVIVAGKPVATIPRQRVVLEIGVLSRF